MEEKMRTFELDGKKRGIRLDTHTWAAIDQLAANLDVKWAELARQWAQDDPKGALENLTSSIRAGAMAGLLARQKSEGVATAQAAATTTPGVFRVEWKSKAAHGSFLLNEKTIDDLVISFEIAKVHMMLLECPEDATEQRERLMNLGAKLLLQQANPHLF